MASSISFLSCSFITMVVGIEEEKFLGFRADGEEEKEDAVVV